MGRLVISDMINICRNCEVVVPEEMITFVSKMRNRLVFRVECSSCGLPTLVDEKGDLIERTPAWSTLV